MSDLTTEPTPAPSPDPDAPPRPSGFGTHPNFGWALLWCLALVLATQVPGGVAAAAILVGWMLMAPADVPQGVAEILAHPVGQVSIGVAIVIAHGLIVLFSLLLLRVVAGRDWHREVAWRLPAWHHVPVVVALWPGFSVLAGGIYYLLRHGLHVPSVSDLGVGGMEEMERAFASWPLALGVFLIGVTPALSEELWCRAFLGRGVVGTHGVVLGVLGTSFLFGMIHVDPCQGAMAMVMGVGLHTVYQLTRSLWMPMLLHFLNNSLAVVLTRFPQAAALDREFGPAHVLLYAGAVVLVGAGLTALYLSRARLHTPPEETPWEPPHPGVACPPAASPTRVVAPRSVWSGVAVGQMLLGFAAMAGGAWLVLAPK